jgi:gas vesicle structural protein
MFLLEAGILPGIRSETGRTGAQHSTRGGQRTPMTVTARSSNRYIERPAPSSLADVINTILDKGLVIDIYVRVSLVGIEILTVDARVVIASVDTYLRFAEAVNRLDISEQQEGLTELLSD